MTEKITKDYLTYPQLPLAIYREVVAHLRQIEGVQAGLITYAENDSQLKFDYSRSQIKALWIEYPVNLNQAQKQRLQQILDYYGQRYSGNN